MADQQANAPKVFVKSFGCQMNVYDSGRMVDALGGSGYVETTAVEDADVIILNTCHIRERATEKIFSELGKLRVLKDEQRSSGRDVRIGVAGCVAQAEGDEIFRRQKAVDFVVGPQSYHRLPDLVARSGSERAIDTEFPEETKFDHLPAPAEETIRRRGISAFVTVQEGCDKFCSFCVVPYTRGAETSRPVGQIIDEIRVLANAGVREVSLLGQNVNAYHGDTVDGRTASLADLSRVIAEIPGIERIRYMTSHPNDMRQDLIDVHASLPALMPFLHLPVQSGSDRILAAMNRKHTAEAYLRIVERIRAVRPDIALSSDFIVGFPGETDQDFEDTLELIRKVEFASAYSFKYSSRPGTPGSDLTEQIDETVKQERLARLQDLLDSQRAAFNTAMVGRECEILIEKPGRHPGQVVGKTPWLQTVQIDADQSLIGRLVRVKITSLSANSLFGEAVMDDALNGAMA